MGREGLCVRDVFVRAHSLPATPNLFACLYVLCDIGYKIDASSMGDATDLVDTEALLKQNAESYVKGCMFSPATTQAFAKFKSPGRLSRELQKMSDTGLLEGEASVVPPALQTSARALADMADDRFQHVIKWASSSCPRSALTRRP